MSDTFILTRSREYVFALKQIGLKRFYQKNGRIYIDGEIRDRILMARIKVELRNRGYQFNYSWLCDVIMSLSNKKANLDDIESLPKWMTQYTNPFTTDVITEAKTPSRGREGASVEETQNTPEKEGSSNVF